MMSESRNVFAIRVAPVVDVNSHHGQVNDDNGEEETQHANHE